jgi:hypothetical protein
MLFIKAPFFRFSGHFASSGFSHSLSIATWLRIIPSSASLTYLIFELQEPLEFNFDTEVQNSALRLYLKGARLEFVDLNWKTSCPASRRSLRAIQQSTSVSLMDGLWHHVAVTVSTELYRVPSTPDDPDVLYLFGTA